MAINIHHLSIMAHYYSIQCTSTTTFICPSNHSGNQKHISGKRSASTDRLPQTAPQRRQKSNGSNTSYGRHILTHTHNHQLQMGWVVTTDFAATGPSIPSKRSVQSDNMETTNAANPRTSSLINDSEMSVAEFEAVTELSSEQVIKHQYSYIRNLEIPTKTTPLRIN